MEKTVYVAESDKAQREEYLKIFSVAEGMRVVGESGSGQTALEEILRLSPNVVVTGLALSSLDGYGLIDRIKEQNKNPRIIVVSALTGEGFISRAIKMGADYYMAKPVDYDTLVKRILREKEEREKRVDKGIDERISNIFMSVGIPAHIKGYQFLREAIKLAVDKPEIINSITKGLYPAIANYYSTTPSKVERAIRHAIEVAWNKGRIENINNVFGVKIYTQHDKPTNGEFIALVADKMLLEQA